MEVIYVDYFPDTYTIRSNETKYILKSYISDDNEPDVGDPDDHMVRLLKKLVELKGLVSGLYNT